MTKPILAAMLSCEGLTLTEEEKKLFAEYNPLGVSLFARNFKSKQQAKNLIDEIRETIGRDDVLIAVDEEGGRVSRLANAGFPVYTSAETLGSIVEICSCWHAVLISKNLRSLGINVNYAPVVDKKTNPQSEVLTSRCFSADEEEIESRAGIMAETYIDNGICPCIKHIPGHFSTLNDPHLSVPATELSRWEIEKKTAYLHSFSKFPLAMTSHILLKSFDAEYPATQSPKVISELIRGYLEFDGFLLSDAIDMHALKGTIAERASLSIRAGVDAVCCCSGRIKDLTAVCGERCFMTEKSLQRYANIKKVIHNKPKCVDVKNIELQYKEKIGSILNVKCSYDATEVLHQMLKKGES